jgi:membrane associated rhomboid family serine protease
MPVRGYIPWSQAMLPISFLPFNDGGPLRYRSLPYGTILLIFINVVIHLYMLDNYGRGLFTPRLWVMWRIFGQVPAHVVDGTGYPGLSSLGAVFLHGGWFHLFFNMIYLWTFGKRVEDACGTPRYLAFYLMAGLMGNWLTVVAFDLGLTGEGLTPGIGASGAISGLMGAYLLLFPRTRISGFFALTVFCVIPIPYRIKLPSWIYLCYFLAVQLYYSYTWVTEGSNNYGVGFLAHLGGFLSGLLIFLYIRKDVFYRYWTKADL